MSQILFSWQEDPSNVSFDIGKILLNIPKMLSTFTILTNIFYISLDIAMVSRNTR